MNLKLGYVKEYELESGESKYLSPGLKLFFNDDLALEYQPVIFDPEGHGTNPDPEGVYYRIIEKIEKVREYCIQYYYYWEEQNCFIIDFGPNNHKYDYEPILIYLKSQNQFPHRIVNAGGRLDEPHKTEIHESELDMRDEGSKEFQFETSDKPYYPWGKQKSSSTYKKYPIRTSLYFDKLRVQFTINICNHCFSGKLDQSPESDKSELLIPLKRLEDSVLNEWYHEHYEMDDEEPFGHDISNPFEFPYVKYFDAKPHISRLRAKS